MCDWLHVLCAPDQCSRILGSHSVVEDLLGLDSCQAGSLWVPKELSGPQSALKPFLPAWLQYLQVMPDQRLARYVFDGINEGFRIGFNGACSLEPATRNLPLAYEHPEVVSEYLDKELRGGRLVRLASPVLQDGTRVQVSRIGVVPKGHTVTQWGGDH